MEGGLTGVEITPLRYLLILLEVFLLLLLTSYLLIDSHMLNLQLRLRRTSTSDCDGIRDS